jgi:transposase
LGVHYKTLGAWLLEYKRSHHLEDNIKASKPKLTSRESFEEENRRLRKELIEVKKEREILKKAAAYFAKEVL